MINATIIANSKMFSSRNGRGFLLPLIRNLSLFKKLGINLKIKYSVKDINKLKCDIIILVSHGIWEQLKKNKNDLINTLISVKKTNRIIFFDINDDTGTNIFFNLLPYVDKYCKAYVYRDRMLYKRNHYGGRIWTDYYHKSFGVCDSPQYPNQPVANEHDLKKICVGYLLGLVNYSRDNTLSTNGYYLNTARKIGVLRYLGRTLSKKGIHNPSDRRINPVSCRISIDYSISRETIVYHRRIIADVLSRYISVDKISRKKYLKEIRDSKIVISPFGWGELNLPRDYEVAMCGAVLMKPEIKHLETYPDIFNEKTIVQFRWDLSDLEQKLNDVLENYEKYIQIAKNLQDKYLYYMCSEEGNNEFCNHFKKILTE